MIPRLLQLFTCAFVAYVWALAGAYVIGGR